MRHHRTFFTFLMVLLSTLFESTPILGQVLTPPKQHYVLRFSGKEIAVAPKTSSLDLGSSFTMEAWIYLEATVSNRMILGKTRNPRGTDPHTNFTIETYNDGQRIEFVQTAGQPGSRRAAISPSPLDLKKWYHVAATLENNTMRLFLNGVQVATQASAGPPIADTVQFAVGGGACAGCTAGGGLVGAMRQVRVWNRALPQNEILTRATTTLSGSETGLIAYWPLDEGSGQYTLDRSPNGLHLQRGLLSTAESSDPPWIQTTFLELGPLFAVTTYSTPASSPGLNYHRLIDLDADGDLDIIGTQAHPNFLPVPMIALRNNGSGNFTDVTSTAFVPSAPLTTAVAEVGFAVADFNKDGRSDVFIADVGVDVAPTPGGQSHLLMQTVDGRLSNETNSKLPIVQAFTHNVSAADIDQDGDIDLYLANICCGSVGPRLYLNNGDGSFVMDSLSRLPLDLRGCDNCTNPPWNALTPRLYTASAFIDADNDGDMDLLLGGFALQGITRFVLLKNDGKGNFTYGPPEDLPLRYGNGNDWISISLTPADFNLDGWTDFVATATSIAPSNEAIIQLVLNNGDGTFRDATYQLPTQIWPKSESFRFVTPTDINGDGLPDFVTSQNIVGTQLFLNRGGGIFVNATELLPSDVGAARTCLPGDFDLDGRIDLSLINGSSQVKILRNLRNIILDDMILPTILQVVPSSAGIGDTVIILGHAFSGATSLRINNTPATFQSLADSLIRWIVPSAATSGLLTITTPRGSVSSVDTFVIHPTPVSVSDGKGTIPMSYSLEQNYPNPFNPTTTIIYALPEESDVSLRVYDVLGRVVETIVDHIQEARVHHANWTANVSSGIYFCRISAHSTKEPSKRFVQTRKLLLIR